VTHAWQVTRSWDVYIAVVTVVVIALVLVSEPSRPLELRLGSAAAIGAFGGWYAALGRRVVVKFAARPAWTFVAGLAVLYATATVCAPTATFLSFALVPLVFTVLDLVPGILAVSGLNLIPPAVHLVSTGHVAETLGVLLPVAFIITVSSSAFAYWVHQIARQSVERADLIEQLAASRAEAARLSRDAGIAAERQRLSGEIHDTIAQGLSSVVMLVQAAEANLDREIEQARHHLRMAGRTARESLAEARALVAGLSPAQLSGATLPAVLARLAQRFREETGIPVDARTAAQPGQLPMSVEVVLLRAAQEGLANVRKHAKATSVTMDLAYPPGNVVLTITDNGIGCDHTAATDAALRADTFGLAAMRARAADVGGTLRVEPAPGGGTQLTVLVPA
jgi:signal transduction histidine kinase